MINLDEQQFAMRCLDKIDQMINQISSCEKFLNSELTKFDNIIANNEKKAVLVAGLTALDITISELNSKRTMLRTIQTYLSSNMITKTEI